MIKILSHDSRPHMVQLYQNGKVVCDENCPMWTSHKISSHCVAVAHCLDCTQDFIGWFTSHSKKLNLTKLCTSKVMQNIGKKPLQNCYSQRKAKPPILSWTLHSSFTSPSTTTINAPFYDGPCALSTGVPFGYLQEPTYPNWWSSYSYQPWGVEMPTNSMLTQNFSLSNSFCNSFGNPANYDASFNTASFNTLSPKNDWYTFWVCKLNKCITTCFGCRGKFTRAADGSLPVAPLNMILRCNESRPYYDRDEKLKEKENANTYYHPNNNYKLQ